MAIEAPARPSVYKTTSKLWGIYENDTPACFVFKYLAAGLY
jgi:hypothetical protein